MAWNEATGRPKAKRPSVNSRVMSKVRAALPILRELRIKLEQDG